LNIFEPRYLALLDDCLKSDHRLIGMVQPSEAPADKPPILHDVGCVGRLTAFSESEDGRYLITLTGVSRFRINEEVEGFTPYRRVKAGWSEFTRDLGAPEEDPGLVRDEFLSVLKGYFNLAKLSSDWDSLKEADDEMLINSLAVLCPFEVEEKQALLEAADLTTRRETLVALMQFAIVSGGAESPVQ